MKSIGKLNNAYNVGIYCRLSKEDGNDESQSIQSQKNILTKYIVEHNWNIVKIYVDDGYSGTNFNRPGFIEMINDIEIGIINLVITKDLSRLGRNYVYTGYYTENYFPEKNIRFIALNDNVDTVEDDNDFAPFKNIINEWYAKDISKKVRFTLDNKAKNGTPKNTVFPIFGYQYNQKYERIPDKETAPIVIMIFDEFLKCGSTAEVAKMLKDKKIKLPMYYNALKYNYNKEKIFSLNEEELINWKARNVRDILIKKEYLGYFITAKTKTKSYKIKKRLINKDGQYEFENKYQPLIDFKKFETVQQMLNKKRTGSLKLDDVGYRNLIICKKCNKVLSVQKWVNKNGKMQIKFLCRNKECKESHVYKNVLDEILKSEVSLIIESFINNFDLLMSNYRKDTLEINYNIKQNLEFYQKRKNEIEILIMKTLELLIQNRISKDTYESMIIKYEKEKESISKSVSLLLESNIDDVKEQTENISFKEFLKKLKEEKIDYRLINRMIKKIKIENSNNNNIIYITYNKLDKNYNLFSL